MSKILWDLLEIEAPERFVINGKDKPAFLFFPKHHYLAQKNMNTLYMNSVGLISTFPTKKKAFSRLKAIIERANFPMRIYRISKHGSHREKRILFAENKVQRKKTTEHPCRAFEIEEWNEDAPKPQKEELKK